MPCNKKSNVIHDIFGLFFINFVSPAFAGFICFRFSVIYEVLLYFFLHDYND